MKEIIFPLLVISTLFARRNNTSSSDKDSISANPALKSQTDGLIKKFKPIIQGVWVKADYVAKVIKTKSPLAAMDEVNDITIMYINTGDIKGDSIIVPEVAGNHDGSTLILKFKQGKSKYALLFGADELSYSVEKNDTVLTYSRFDKEKKDFVKTKYIRIFKREPNNDLADGMYYYINRGLVAGKYTFTDSTGAVAKVFFSEEGKVTGLSDFNDYLINIDLNSDVNDNLDGIGFDRHSKHHMFYTFKIVADTLNLYDTRENADSTKLILDKLKYKLVRQR